MCYINYMRVFQDAYSNTLLDSFRKDCINTISSGDFKKIQYWSDYILALEAPQTREFLVHFYGIHKVTMKSVADKTGVSQVEIRRLRHVVYSVIEAYYKVITTFPVCDLKTRLVNRDYQHILVIELIAKYSSTKLFRTISNSLRQVGIYTLAQLYEHKDCISTFEGMGYKSVRAVNECLVLYSQQWRIR